MQEQPAPADGDRLVSLLARQCDLYRKLKELSEKQRGLIAGDRPDMLLGILQERQAHVRELTMLNQQLSSFRRDWQATFKSLTAEIKERVSELLATINTLLSAIIETDKEDGALLSARKQMAAAELSGLSGGRIANQSYARSTPAPNAGSADLTG